MFSDPQRNIEQLELEVGMSVADFGAGSGFYSLAAARIVGATGRVYAIDVQKELLEKLRNNAHRGQLFNLEVLWGDLEKLGGTHLRDLLVDVVVAANIFFQVGNKEILVKEIKRILKPRGKVLLVDWASTGSSVGPQPDQLVPKTVLKSMFEKENFTVLQEISAGDHHYGFIFRKP